MKPNKLIVITGPSGVGKGTLVKLLLTRHPQFYLSISATTRQPRQGENDGKDYYFVSREKFQKMIQQQELLEWAEYANNYYGTPIKPIETQLNQGKSVILEIELVGARKVKKHFPNAMTIFILPPSMAILEERLRGRATDNETAVRKRLHQATVEMAASQEFDQQIVNDDLEKAIQQIEKAIFS